MAEAHYSRGPDLPRRVFIAIPCYEGKIPVRTMIAVHESIRLLNSQGISADLCIESGNCHVDDTRNALVRYFLSSDCESLIFLDADVSFTPDTLLKLVDYDHDVIAGVYPVKKDGQDYPVRTLPGAIQSEHDGTVEVEGVPTGFLKVSRECLEHLSEEAPVYHCRGSDSPYHLVFERTLENGIRFSGDYAFCRKWRKLGGKVFVDPHMNLSHEGSTRWEGTLADHWTEKLSMKWELDAVSRGTETDETYDSLIEKWGNPEWSGTREFLKACVKHARESETILECGSGLTTIVMAAVGKEIHSLEHDPEWANRVNAVLDAHGLKANIYCGPLRYDITTDCNWYQLPDLPEYFDLAVCDGPPREISDREGLYLKLGDRLGKIIMDDTNDPRQLNLLERWGRPITRYEKYAEA